jgi:hypothetical protein
MTARTSSRVRTVGSRLGRLARTVVEPGQVLLEDVAVEEQESVQRLVLGRGGNLALDGQGTQEARDLGSAHLEGMRLAMEADVPADPPDVGRLGASTPVAQPDGFPDPVEQFRRARAGRVRSPRHQIRSRSRVPDALIDDESHSARRIVPGQSTRKTSAEGCLEAAQVARRGPGTGFPVASPNSAPGRSCSHWRRRASISSLDSSGCSAGASGASSPRPNRSRASRSRRAAASRPVPTAPFYPGAPPEAR